MKTRKIYDGSKHDYNMSDSDVAKLATNIIYSIYSKLKEGRYVEVYLEGESTPTWRKFEVNEEVFVDAIYRINYDLQTTM